MRIWIITAALAALGGCPGDDGGETGGGEAELRWYTTCGDPACSGYGGPFDGEDLCSEVEGAIEGELCETEGQQCDPVDDCNARLICAAEDPKDQTGGCPISLGSAKREVSYLSPAELEAVQQELLAMKLARWAYSDDPEGVHRLGFIIDDVGGDSPALRPGGERVDLYGYASMTAATLQAQAAQIAALEARLAALEATCAQPER